MASRVRLILIVYCLLAASASAKDARVEVATLDGAPVYHWQAFKSALPGDVDRALILREFERKKFTIPQKLVDEAVQREVAGNFGGDTTKFTQHLHGLGASLEDYRQFSREEIIVSAMLYQKEKNPTDKARKQAVWLARLRAGTTVKRLPAKVQAAKK